MSESLDWAFILEAVKWSKYYYEQASGKYLYAGSPHFIEGYYANEFRPKMSKFDETIGQLQKIVAGQ